MSNIEMYLNGTALYGDDFDAEKIAEWFADEKEGFADLGAKDAANYEYGYHALNKFHGFKYLPNAAQFNRVLGFGSAYGEELQPVSDRVQSATIVDPSDAFIRDSVYGIPLEYVKPKPDGSLPFDDNTFDLITCFGVLHHIPNVSAVVSQLARVLNQGGHMLLREPIVSMGDWRQPRRGLTKRERGIPLPLLREIIQKNGLEIVNCALCDFPVTERVFLKLNAYNSFVASLVDAWVSAAFAWNVNYHPKNSMQRFRPRSAFLVIRKSV